MKNETAKSADYKMVKFRDPATGKIKFRKVKHDDAIVQQETMDPRDFTDKPGHVVVVKKKDGTRKIKHYHPSSAGAKKYADRVNKVNRVGDKATVHKTDGRKIHGESFRYRPDPFKSRASLAKSAKYKEAEAEYQKDKEFARKILQVFSEDTPKNIKSLKKAFSAKDEIQINKIGHKIKSSFRMFKLKVPFEYSLWIENFSSEKHSWEELDEYVSLLDKECSKYLKESR